MYMTLPVGGGDHRGGLRHSEGATDKSVKLNVVYVLESGQPLASPAK